MTQRDENRPILDQPCRDCNGTGKVAHPHGAGITNDCEICYGTGYQVTQAGLELLNFIRRQKKRIEREQV